MLSTFDGPQLKRRCDRFALIRFGSRIRVLAFTVCDGCLMKKEGAVATMWEFQAECYSDSKARIKNAIRHHKAIK